MIAFLYIIFNTLDAIVFKLLKMFSVNFARYSKTVTVILIAGAALLLAYFVSSWFLGLFALLFGLRTDKGINEKKIHVDTERVRESETLRLNESLNRSDQKVYEVEESVKQSELQTKEAANRDYSDVNNRELENQLREKLKR